MSETSCPADHLLLALVSDDQTDASVRSHIETCDACRRRFEQIQVEVAMFRKPRNQELVHSAITVEAGGSNVDTYETHEESSQEAGLPDRLGRFILIRALGKGTFGDVHLAYDPLLDRRVAIKVARVGLLVGESDVDRFRREARSAAQLRHPHIVPVHEVGTVKSSTFIVYGFVEGETLRARLKACGKFPHQQAVDLISKLAIALHYAHSHKIVHRDIKPDNVILDHHGEPHLADFGSARRDDSGTTRTLEGMLIGTPAYMSPEQASGKGHVADPRSDIWSLGVVLAELLSGQRPFAGSVTEILKAIQQTDPKPLRDSDPSIPRDLQTICEKCMSKEPADRYQTAEELADDLRRWQRDEPILARRTGAAARVLRWARRNPTTASLTAAVFCLLLVGITVSSFFALVAHQKEQQRIEAEIRALRTASPAAVPLIIDNLRRSRGRVMPELNRLLRTDLSEREEARVRLTLTALSTAADDRVVGGLVDDMTKASAAEFLVLRELAREQGPLLAQYFWNILRDEQLGSDTRFRAACALALYDPQNPEWDTFAAEVVQKLLQECSLALAESALLRSDRSESTSDWIRALKPIRDRLLPQLKGEFAADQPNGFGYLAAAALAEMFADQTDLIVELLMASNARQLTAFVPKLQDHSERAVPLLVDALRRHREVPQAARTSAAADQMVNTAVALLSLGKLDHVLPLLQQTDDRSLRTLIIHQIGDGSVAPDRVMESLERTDQTLALISLILGLGDYDRDKLGAVHRRYLTPRLVELYRDHTNSGVHSAAGWVLRKWGQWELIQRIDRSIASAVPTGKRQWYVNGQGQTLAVFGGPVTFQMGSPPHEVGRYQNERQHTRRIPRSFALATKEVTVAEFLGFRPDYQADSKYNPDPECPALQITWFEAARYCRWLSEREGIPENQMCFPPIEQINGEMSLDEVHLDRIGYRLPTAAEWEYACRGGASTSRHFGRQEEMLRYYAWYNANSQDRTWPVGLLEPNDFGLFDVYGNAAEWCLTLYFHNYPYPESEVVIDRLRMGEPNQFELRGGSYQHPPTLGRSAWRDYQRPDLRSLEFGFRVARTLPDDE